VERLGSEITAEFTFVMPNALFSGLEAFGAAMIADFRRGREIGR
jgi:hypothetical protein